MIMNVLFTVFVAGIVMMITGSFINGFGKKSDSGSTLLGLGTTTFLVTVIWMLIKMHF